MSLAEMLKRCVEIVKIYGSMCQYRHIEKWPYSRFAEENKITLDIKKLPCKKIDNNFRKWRIYNESINLREKINWFYSSTNKNWPNIHYQKIDYRPGNQYGDIRINWEINRLQFLPTLALDDPRLTQSIIKDWLEKNRYLHGPAYVASMEVCIRWISIYWAICNLKKITDTALIKDITGLCYISGKYIESRLSTHSSAGNHLIVEAVGLFWIGKALKRCKQSKRWINLSRRILWDQIRRQINCDGTNKEQSFWYLGFVMDAIAHYLLLECDDLIPRDVKLRIIKAIEFLNYMTLDNGNYPDYGDRDDGFIFRISPDYDESPFPGILSTYARLLDRPEWFRKNKCALQRMQFWTSDYSAQNPIMENNKKDTDEYQMKVKTFQDGGLTVFDWKAIRIIFDHGPLGLDNTCGHGHADALSIILFWKNECILLDPGSGQYNGSKEIRNYFRSTLAHNTLQIEGKNQAEIAGPFLWNKPYKTKLIQKHNSPDIRVKASHDGYYEKYGAVHQREIAWKNEHQFIIKDDIKAAGRVSVKGAFHISDRVGVALDNATIRIDHQEFSMFIKFEKDVKLKKFTGSINPFLGWNANIYGHWTPIHTVLYDYKEKSMLSSSIIFSYHLK